MVVLAVVLVVGRRPEEEEEKEEEEGGCVMWNCVCECWGVGSCKEEEEAEIKEKRRNWG